MIKIPNTWLRYRRKINFYVHLKNVLKFITRATFLKILILRSLFVKI